MNNSKSLLSSSSSSSSSSASSSAITRLKLQYKSITKVLNDDEINYLFNIENLAPIISLYVNNNYIGTKNALIKKYGSEEKILSWINTEGKQLITELYINCDQDVNVKNYGTSKLRNDPNYGMSKEEQEHKTKLILHNLKMKEKLKVNKKKNNNNNDDDEYDDDNSDD